MPAFSTTLGIGMYRSFSALSTCCPLVSAHLRNDLTSAACALDFCTIAQLKVQIGYAFAYFFVAGGSTMCISLFAGTFFTSDAADWIERMPGVVNFPAL